TPKCRMRRRSCAPRWRCRCTSRFPNRLRLMPSQCFRNARPTEVHVVELLDRYRSYHRASRDASPVRGRRNQFTFHGQRKGIKRGSLAHGGIIEHDRAWADIGPGTDGHGRHFHDTVLEQVSLERRCPANCSVLAYVQEVELRSESRLAVDPLAHVDAKK